MKQILVCYKENRRLRVRSDILTDVFVPVQDVISPQKTTLTVPKNDKVQLNDIIIIKDNSSGVVEYIGYIDTLVTNVNTEMSCYPLINVFDNDFVLDQLYNAFQQKQRNENGDVVKDENGNDVTVEVHIAVDAVDWLYTQITRAFIETEDDLQALPLVVEKKCDNLVLYKKALDTANLFEAYIDLFVQTGVYVVFGDLVYDRNEISGIKCEIRCNRDHKPYRIYEHDPIIKDVNIVDNTFQNYNKIIATEEVPDGEEREPQRFYFYLLSNNDITTDPNHPMRIKQVRSKAISFSLATDEGEEDGLTEEQKQESRAKALILAIYNELQAPEYDLKIEIDMMRNSNLFLYRHIDFVAESGIMYTTNITKIEQLNEMQVRITLGALRNSLTDFKKKVEVI